MNAPAGTPGARRSPAAPAADPGQRMPAPRPGPSRGFPDKSLPSGLRIPQARTVTGVTQGGSDAYGQLRVNGRGQLRIPGRPLSQAWPVRSGVAPPLADGFTTRAETVPGLEAGLVPGAGGGPGPRRGRAGMR